MPTANVFNHVFLPPQHCHSVPELRDEVYCQLMKQTTSNRSGGADSCQRAWRLMSILAAYFTCSDTLRYEATSNSRTVH